MDPRRVLGLLGRLYEEILRQAITLVTAVSICMLTVSVLIRVLESSRNDDLRLGYVRYPDKDGEGGGEEEPVMLMSSFANAFSFLSVIMIVNCTMVLLYKGGHYRIIQTWLMGGSAILLFATGYYYGGRLLFYFNVSVDHLTWSFITWNVGMAGIAALYFDGPFLMQQGYLIYTSVLMALTIEESLPEWTSWTLLVLISIWDVFAVLCRNRPDRPAYTTDAERRYALQAPADGLPGDRGMKMGLGDFIFYSVLVGEASRLGSAATVVACYVSIIVGIFLTLALLVVLQKPLPALPLSISLGMLAYFSSVSLTEPFLDAVGSLAL
ncbi:presenilin-1 [Dermacentor silvarum]|uniref:presenilin-1 n=1 Tax=Dermacentor silvarum TaxID=543639 RepID=UPI00189980D5|nr:presenilin-1 [Dermacentor silvarum]